MTKRFNTAEEAIEYLHQAVILQEELDKSAPPIFQCPKCRGRGEVDIDQWDGGVSIVCPCGWHGYRNSDGGTRGA